MHKVVTLQSNFMRENNVCVCYMLIYFYVVIKDNLSQGPNLSGKKPLKHKTNEKKSEKAAQIVIKFLSNF